MTDDVSDFLAGLKPDEMLLIARRRGDGRLVLLSHDISERDAEEIIDLIHSAGAPRNRRHDLA